MQDYYIQAPLSKPNITVIKCKAPRHKRAKRKEVPVEYRKNRWKKLQDWFFDAKQETKEIFRRIKNYGKEKY